MHGNPSGFKNSLNPVEDLTWDEAIDFCRKLTSAEKADLPAGFAYALPTEAQWNALLGGAKFEDNVTSRTAPRNAPAAVGSMPPNELGLCDLLGNVWEWCNDPQPEQKHLAKGGAFNNSTIVSRKPFDGKTPNVPREKHNVNIGFRCLLVPE
jgi:formylglycine-generating enzyme required for sulfatase activity